jgi:hypothetical protein
MRKLAAALTIIFVATTLAMAPATALAISKSTAHRLTLQYARHACRHDNWCHFWGATGCVRTSAGVTCAALNYEKHHGKYTCRRSILWKNRHHGELLTPWQCGHRGWN